MPPPKIATCSLFPMKISGAWVMEQTGRKMTLWKGNCYAHVEFRRDAILKLREKYPDAKKSSSTPESLPWRSADLADSVCSSTEKMIVYRKTDPAEKIKQSSPESENHDSSAMQKECPDKRSFFCRIAAFGPS